MNHLYKKAYREILKESSNEQIPYKGYDIEINSYTDLDENDQMSQVFEYYIPGLNKIGQNFKSKEACIKAAKKDIDNSAK